MTLFKSPTATPSPNQAIVTKPVSYSNATVAKAAGDICESEKAVATDVKDAFISPW